MDDHDSPSLTIVGGRPNEEGKEPSAISPGLQALLQRLAENPSLARDLVAPFAGDPDFYMGERTRGIRPLSIYPTPFAVTGALLRTSEDFRTAF